MRVSKRQKQHRQRQRPYHWPPPHEDQARASAASSNGSGDRIADTAAAISAMEAAAAAKPAMPVSADVKAMLSKWTEGVQPGSHEWVQALRAHATQPKGWEAEWTKW